MPAWPATGSNPKPDPDPNWRKPSRHVTPEVYHMKQLLLAVGPRAVFYCDLHGHSRSKGTFMYGCRNTSP